VLNAGQIVAQACTDAKQFGYSAIAQTKLQVILDEICLKQDYGCSRKVYYFPLNPSNINIIGGTPNFGGPYPLPLDYLRTSGSTGSDGVQYSLFYMYQGVPYPLQPWDLGRMDMQVQQAGIQNLPYAGATDVSPGLGQERIVGTTTAMTTQNTTSITVFSPVKATVGMSVCGDGIAAGAVITGMSGPGNTIWTLSLPCVLTFVGALSSGTQGAGAASIMWGNPVDLFVYPGPSGSFPTTLRYQALLPPLVDMTRYPWFPDQNFLLKRLTADLSITTDETRYTQLIAESKQLMGDYSKMADDKRNRAQRVMLDRQRFGRGYSKLGNTKTIGW
jgi:hypothetical protein